MLASYILLGCIVLIILPLPFSEKYRDFVVRGNGESRIFGVTARGSVFVLLVALILSGTIYLQTRVPPQNSCIGPNGAFGRIYMVVGTSDKATHADENPSNPLPGEPVYSKGTNLPYGYAKWSCAIE